MVNYPLNPPLIVDKFLNVGQIPETRPDLVKMHMHGDGMSCKLRDKSHIYSRF